MGNFSNNLFVCKVTEDGWGLSGTGDDEVAPDAIAWAWMAEVDSAGDECEIEDEDEWVKCLGIVAVEWGCWLGPVVVVVCDADDDVAVDDMFDAEDGFELDDEEREETLPALLLASPEKGASVAPSVYIVLMIRERDPDCFFLLVSNASLTLINSRG